MNQTAIPIAFRVHHHKKDPRQAKNYLRLDDRVVRDSLLNADHPGASVLGTADLLLNEGWFLGNSLKIEFSFNLGRSREYL